MSMAKADMGVLASYFALVTDDIKEQFWPVIFDEYQKSVAMIEKITGKALLADDTTLARGITLRNPYVDPISYLQVELLQRLRSLSSTESTIESASEDEIKELESAVLISLIGVAAGMRNTG